MRKRRRGTHGSDESKNRCLEESRSTQERHSPTPTCPLPIRLRSNKVSVALHRKAKDQITLRDLSGPHLLFSFQLTKNIKTVKILVSWIPITRAYIIEGS